MTTTTSRDEASKPHASSSCGSDGPREAHPTTLQSSSPRRDEPNQVNKWDPGSHPKPPRIEASLPFRSAAQSHRRLSPNPSGDPIQGHPPPPPPPPATGPSSLRRRTAPISNPNAAAMVMGKERRDSRTRPRRRLQGLVISFDHYRACFRV
ncbi:formin-like protein 6 [Panicum hallii]|uniref:formin-like protein 6 n=1 Tax=Panicum hallii TaxID=206008 RepID=UPI000DF4DA94|nr:formin-like protein 6 [Panicum hallii]